MIVLDIRESKYSFISLYSRHVIHLTDLINSDATFFSDEYIIPLINSYRPCVIEICSAYLIISETKKLVIPEQLTSLDFRWSRSVWRNVWRVRLLLLSRILSCVWLVYRRSLICSICSISYIRSWIWSSVCWIGSCLISLSLILRSCVWSLVCCIWLK